MSNLIARFVKDESGATAIEYGLIAALIALAIMVGAGALGNALNAKFTNIAARNQRFVIPKQPGCFQTRAASLAALDFIVPASCDVWRFLKSRPHQSLIEHA